MDSFLLKPYWNKEYRIGLKFCYIIIISESTITAYVIIMLPYFIRYWLELLLD